MADADISGKSWSPARRAALVAVVYGLLGVLWILFSDDLIARIAEDQQQLSRMQTAKGWFYVLVTALLLYWMIRRAFQGLVAARYEATRAATDELTGLPGHYRLRTLLAENIERARLSGGFMALVVLDVAQLRRINEAFGTAAGDNLLIQIARRLREMDVCQAGRVLLARPGGGQFLAICPAPCDKARAQSLALEMVQRVTGGYQIANGHIDVRVHAGVGLYPRDGYGGRPLRRAAEAAVHDAKMLRMPVALFSERSEQVREQLALESDLHAALSRKQFRIYFQPLVRTRDGRIIGAEALLRWEHPVLGLIEPDRFIPLLEESGDIVEVGDWVLNEAIRFAVAWPAGAEGDLKVSVNVSRLQLESPGFRSGLVRALSESGIAPQRLMLEITESLVMTNPEENMSRMQAIHDAGVGLAMDDFGTGYSSLAYLKRYPLSLIKVDRAFVQGIPDDVENDLLMETIVEMSRRLQRQTVAEGVETPRELERLREIGCEMAQGYLFSRPLPADEFAELVRSGRDLLDSDSISQRVP